MIFYYVENSVMPLIQRKTILKDFENHKLKYTMKYGFFNKLFYSFGLIIQLLIFSKCKIKISDIVIYH